MSGGWTYREILRAHRTLRRRLKHVQGLVSIGFGCARKRGEVDAERPFAICVYLRNKRKRVSKRELVPPIMRLRLKREDRFQHLELASDVVHCPSGEWTGRWLRTQSPHAQLATVGPVLRWIQLQDNEPSTHYAFLTVAHPFRNVPLQSAVQIATAFGEWSQFGVLIARSSTGSSQDVALVEVTKRTLQRLQPKMVQRVRLATNEELVQGLGSTGAILRVDGAFPFQWGVYHPRFESIFQLGPLSDIFEGFGSTAYQFGPGTSGAAWSNGDQLAGLQTAGLLADQFQNGLGQSIMPRIEWAMRTLSRLPGWVAGSLAIDSIY